MGGTESVRLTKSTRYESSLFIFALVAVDPFSNALAGVLIDISLMALFAVASCLTIVTGVVASASAAIREAV